jgi:dihydrofolate reductase
VAKLIYSAITSLDGYIEDEGGNFDWAQPDEEVHTFFNDLARPIGTHLYGRRMYETMAYWETVDSAGDQPEFVRDFARIWQGAEKVVYSKTLEAPTTPKTRIERSFDPEVVREMKASAQEDLMIGGPGLAATAFRGGLVDECHLCLTPIIVGGGKPALPDGVRLELELLDERRFSGGMVYLRHQTRS